MTTGRISRKEKGISRQIGSRYLHSRTASAQAQSVTLPRVDCHPGPSGVVAAADSAPGLTVTGIDQPATTSVAPHRISTAPGSRATQGPGGSKRSARMNPHSAAMVSTLIAPPANIITINPQQQPIQ